MSEPIKVFTSVIRKTALGLALFVLGVTTHLPGQVTPSGAFWTGQAQCQLTMQSQGYTHQEIQTWTITGTPPGTAGMQVYPGTWTVTGQGGVQRLQGTQVLAARWNTNVPAI